MKERPILFSGPMVRAILDGRKTQTRRVVKPQPPHDFGPWNNATTRSGGNEDFGCPFGRLGDRLWVRETWCNPAGDDNIVFRADWQDWEIHAEKVMRHQCPGIAAAYPDSRWKPSIHMPRKFCRLLLDVKSVRVEHLKDITIETARAEGVEPLGSPSDGRRWRAAFRELWDSLNLKRGYGWDTNPWIWVIEFQTVEDTNP